MVFCVMALCFAETASIPCFFAALKQYRTTSTFATSRKQSLLAQLENGALDKNINIYYVNSEQTTKAIIFLMSAVSLSSEFIEKKEKRSTGWMEKSEEKTFELGWWTILICFQLGMWS